MADCEVMSTGSELYVHLFSCSPNSCPHVAHVRFEFLVWSNSRWCKTHFYSLKTESVKNIFHKKYFFLWPMLGKVVAHCDCSSKLFPEVRLILGHDGCTQPKPAQFNTSMVKPKLCSAFHRKHCNFIQLYTNETKTTNCIANNVPGGESSCHRHQMMWELWDDNLQVVHPPQGRIFHSCRGEYLITILYASVNIVWILPRVSGPVTVTLACNSHTITETSKKMLPVGNLTWKHERNERI